MPQFGGLHNIWDGLDSPGVYGGAAGPEHNKMDQFLADSHANPVENLVNLDLIPSSKFTLYCFPIYATGSNAAPCRVMANKHIDEDFE